MKKSTIKDVAEYTGLSITTISRYINRNYPISVDSEEKIKEAIRVLGYKPNLVARSLKKNCTGIVGLIVTDISNGFFMNVAKGMEDILWEEEYQIMFASNDGSLEKEHRLIAIFEERRIDGLVIAPSDTCPDTINQFAGTGTPVIVIGRRMDGMAAQAVAGKNPYEMGAEAGRIIIGRIRAD
ncbi:MAG: LacI family transcriptional regulator [Hungatella sp.]|nr:LacI family transcriptional regulator [Hungatella sp.]